MLRAFPGSGASITSTPWCLVVHASSVDNRPDLHGSSLRLNPGQPSPGQHSLLRPLRGNASTGILTCFPIVTPFGLALAGSTHLPRLTLDGNRRSSGRRAFSTALSLLMSAFALLIPPACLWGHLHGLTERSTQQRISVAAAASVHGLAPLHLPRRPTRPVSYYAFFK